MADGAPKEFRYRRQTWTGIASVLLAVALAVGVYLAWAHPLGGGLAAGWVEAHPVWALGLITVAGFLDGMNPCAFTTLLLFLGAVLAAWEQAAGAVPGSQRRVLWSISGAYIAGMFLLYLALGLGFLQLAWLRAFSTGHAITRIAAGVALLLGLVTVREYFVPKTSLRMTMSGALHGAARRWTRPATAGAAFLGGILIGLCTIPCGGGMYLGVVGLLGNLANRAAGLGLLLAYNLAFVLPLVLVVAAAGSRPALQALSRWHIRSRLRVKLVLGMAMIAIGLVVLAMA